LERKLWGYDDGRETGLPFQDFWKRVLFEKFQLLTPLASTM
jgi:hypothetical protein